MAGPQISVTVDGSAVIRMLEQIADNAGNLRPVMGNAASRAAGSVVDIPVRSGRLASSPRVGSVDADSARIVSDVEYAPYVFFGTKYMAPEPPSLRYGPAELAQNIADEIFY